MNHELEHFERVLPRDPDTINGWGVDADPENDPTYPMRKTNCGEHKGYTWQRPPLQHTDVEVLHSNERPNLTAVYGVSVPPSGLSGNIRRWAFRYSESSMLHWMPLLLADRVNMVEGLVDDVRSGHVPNVFAERGWRASWKYDRKRMLIKCGVAAFIGLAAYACLKSRREDY